MAEPLALVALALADTPAWVAVAYLSVAAIGLAVLLWDALAR